MGKKRQGFWPLDKKETIIKMININKYFDNLEYQYIQTYSGLRGDSFDKMKIDNELKVRELREQILGANSAKIREEMRVLRNEMTGLDIKVVDEKGKLHKTAHLIARINKNDLIDKRIQSILQFKEGDFHHSRCVPIYRDVLVFYSDKEEINGILHVCFDCNMMKDERDNEFKFASDWEWEIYEDLKEVMKSVGHEIE